MSRPGNGHVTPAGIESGCSHQGCGLIASNPPDSSTPTTIAPTTTAQRMIETHRPNAGRLICEVCAHQPARDGGKAGHFSVSCRRGLPLPKVPTRSRHDERSNAELPGAARRASYNMTTLENVRSRDTRRSARHLPRLLHGAQQEHTRRVTLTEQRLGQVPHQLPGWRLVRRWLPVGLQHLAWRNSDQGWLTG